MHFIIKKEDKIEIIYYPKKLSIAIYQKATERFITLVAKKLIILSFFCL